MYVLYSALLAVLLLLTLPYWLIQMFRHGKYRAGLRQRLGVVPTALALPHEKRTIWVHAVSVGEVIASTGVIKALQQKFPLHRVVISTTTSTGQKLAAQRFGRENVFYFPIDFAFAIRPYLAAFHPELIVLAETELWPNFIRLSKTSGARVVVINCRISNRSLPGYKRAHRWLPRLVQSTLDAVDIFLAQTEQDRQRLHEIGVDETKIAVAGNLKFEVTPPSESEIVRSLTSAIQQSSAGPVLVCGSTLTDEEGALLSMFRNVLVNHPKAVMVLAPRHPERLAEVAALVEQLGFRLLRRSLWSGESLAGSVFLLDTIGELASIYSLATVAFVGGSLVPRGGHNILEPALYGVPIITGNHYENFRDIVNFFLDRNAVRVVGLAEMPLAFIELIDNKELREMLGHNALAALESQRGVTARTIAALAKLVDRPS